VIEVGLSRDYLVYGVARKAIRNPSEAQQRILDQMRPGAWYVSKDRAMGGKCTNRLESCRALVKMGYLVMGRPGRDAGGTLELLTQEELLIDALAGGNPVLVYRLA
jgi:hypothetical protein